jgi:RHS repeat-associated protein
MAMPGRKYVAASGYSYGFNGKENDNEVKGEGNQQDYGMRIYDPRLGKFLSVDPLTQNYPFLTPYAFAENDVISSIDRDGLEKYRVVGRSFAPRWSFKGTHFESKADDRTKFEVADFKKVSARIHVQVTINMNEGSQDPVFIKEIYSQPTILKGGSSWNIDREEINIKSTQGATESYVDPIDKEVVLRGDYYAKNGTDIGPGIDIQFDITLKGNTKYMDDDNNILKVSAKITGNIFPAQETLIFDEKGTGLFIGTSTAIGGPLSGVWGSGKNNTLSSESFRVQTDDDGNFLGVLSTDANGNEVVMNPAVWNKKFTDKKTWNRQDLYNEKTGELKEKPYPPR